MGGYSLTGVVLEFASGNTANDIQVEVWFEEADRPGSHLRTLNAYGCPTNPMVPKTIEAGPEPEPLLRRGEVVDVRYDA